MSKRRLGKGIDALLQGRPLDQLQTLSSIMMVEIDHIAPNPNQPRKRFDDTSLNELADSIREKGIIQPIIAEDQGDGHFIIIAGERRYRAAKIAGLEEVPVISQDLTDEEKLEIALIENIQREDLNPIDEARALKHAMEAGGLTQEQLAKRLGKSRPAVANSLRLLRLDDDIQQALSAGAISAGHARALVGLADPAERRELYDRIVKENLSVRQTELSTRDGRLLPPAATPPRDEQKDDNPPGTAPELPYGGQSLEPKHDTSAPKDVELKEIRELLIGHFGTRVVVRGTSKRGQIQIEYHSTDDLERIIEAMGIRLGE